ncbi:hypothetical protein HK098_002400 [Nowakowskiella sp. JEL0407]|nr:hypothetical protein HK098_002400 [Nowakowskiella sp. JEL0407]
MPHTSPSPKFINLNSTSPNLRVEVSPPHRPRQFSFSATTRSPTHLSSPEALTKPTSPVSNLGDYHITELISTYELYSARRLLRRFLFGEKVTLTSQGVNAVEYLSPTISYTSPESYLSQARSLQLTNGLRIFGVIPKSDSIDPTSLPDVLEDIPSNCIGVIVFRILQDPIFGKHIYVDYTATKNEMPASIFGKDPRLVVRKALLGFVEKFASNLGIPLVRQSQNEVDRNTSLAARRAHSTPMHNRSRSPESTQLHYSSRAGRFSHPLLAEIDDEVVENPIPTKSQGSFSSWLDFSQYFPQIPSPAQQTQQEPPPRKTRGRAGSLHTSATTVWGDSSTPLSALSKTSAVKAGRNRSFSHAAAYESIQTGIMEDGVEILDLPKRDRSKRRGRSPRAPPLLFEPSDTVVSVYETSGLKPKKSYHKVLA